MNGGAGCLLYHYNRPYGDVYMEIARRFRLNGLGTYMVQELKARCRANGGVPAGRCNVDNLASRKTLSKVRLHPVREHRCGRLAVTRTAAEDGSACQRTGWGVRTASQESDAF